jgi:hypothetical protein
MNTARLSQLAAAGALVALLTGCQLTPQQWGPITSSYKDRVRVEGEGTFFNDSGADAVNRMTIKDRADDGNNVYGKTSFMVWKYNSVQGRDTWVLDQAKSTGEIRNQSKTVSLRTSLDQTGSRYRGVSQACAQMGWPVPDSCSTAVPTFNY